MEKSSTYKVVNLLTGIYKKKGELSYDDINEALKKMDKIEEIRKKLPGLDCGSCGSPTCQALAEDIVGGYAREMDCLFLLKEQVRRMAEQMVDLSELTREK